MVSISLFCGASYATSNGRIRPEGRLTTEKENDKAPNYRILAGATEFGAAWNKTARETDREYLSVKLDDPSFPAPIYASLVKGEGDDSYTLIWFRRNTD
jgi:uncharacterized protein (DUF736 family)